MIMQQKMSRCKEEAKTLLRKEVLLKARNHNFKPSVDIERVWQMQTAILDTRAGPTRLKENCLSRVRAGQAVTIKVARVRFAANTQLHIKELIRLTVQLGQKKAKSCFLIVTDLATDVILRTVYINASIGRISPKKDTLKPTSTNPVAIEESVGNPAYKANNLELKQGHPEDEFNEYPRTVVCKRISPRKSEVYCDVKRKSRGVQLLISHENLLKTRHALVAQEIVEAVSTKPFVIKMANWSCQQMPVSKEMKAETCLQASTSRMDSWGPVEEMPSTRIEDSVSATQIYKASESREQIFERHHQVMQKDADKAGKH